MKKSDIIKLPNPNLRKRSKKITSITPKIKQLIKDMESATLDWEDSRDHEVGVALAAVQLNSMQRLIIVRKDFDDKKNRTFFVLINPEIKSHSKEISEDYEGCLSISDVYGLVPRYKSVEIKALDENGKEVELKADGFLSRVLQHEIDHTKGKVFIDHIKDNKKSFFRLNKEGKLEPLDYEKEIRKNSILWQ